jgi:4-amino-4-deoxy-L-arabinose transferase-like glycosyltransferase
MSEFFPMRLRWTQIGIALAIVLLALALRVGVVFQRASADDVAFFPPPGTDELTYHMTARALLEGEFPTGAFYYHPGITYAFGALMALSDVDFGRSRLMIALWDSLVAGGMIAVGWLLVRRPLAGYLAGVLWAVYPMALFYSTSYWDSTLSAGYVTFTMWLALWQRERLSWWRSVGLGLLAGMIAVTRMNLIPLLAVWGVWMLWMAPHWRARLWHGLLYVGVMVAVIAPFTAWNAYATGGAFIPIATTGRVELYMVNNRHANGFHVGNNAVHTLDVPQFEGIVRDIAVDPLRFLALVAYKFTSFWSSDEIGNGYAYEEVFARAPLLGVAPLGHAFLAIMAGVGLWFGWRMGWRGTPFLAGLLLWMLFSHTVTMIFSRMRFPSVPVLVLLTAGALSVLAHSEGRKLIWSRGTAVTFLVGVLLWGVSSLDASFIPKRTYRTLPPDAIGLNVTFADELTLVGWRKFPQWWQVAALGTGVPNQSYTVELFWQANRPLTRDYTFFIAYVQDGERLGGYDLRLGEASFPPLPTSRWQTNVIYGEVVGLRLPQVNAERNSGEITVGAYYGDDEGVIAGLPITQPQGLTRVVLQPLAVYAETVATIPADTAIFRDFVAPNGDTIALIAADMPTQARVGETVTIRLAWVAPSDVKRNYALFLHVVDEENATLVQGDGALAPRFPTEVWLPNVRFERDITLQMPDKAGTYTVFMGVLDAETLERLATDALDNRPSLGQIVVR